MNTRAKCLPLPSPATNPEHGERAAAWLATQGILPGVTQNYEQFVHAATLDAAAAANCAALGADPFQLRLVSHWARFSHECHLRKFGKALAHQLCVVDDCARLPGEPGIVVAFHTFGFTQQEDLSARSTAIHKLTQRFGGVYEGWQVDIDRHELDQGCQSTFEGDFISVGVATGHRRKWLKHPTPDTTVNAG